MLSRLVSVLCVVQCTFKEGELIAQREAGIDVSSLQRLSLALHRELVGLPGQVTDKQLCGLHVVYVCVCVQSSVHVLSLPL